MPRLKVQRTYGAEPERKSGKEGGGEPISGGVMMIGNSSLGFSGDSPRFSSFRATPAFRPPASQSPYQIEIEWKIKEGKEESSSSQYSLLFPSSFSKRVSLLALPPR